MADSTVQESLLERIPQELRQQIDAAPRDIHEKVHQRELLMIEQIRHFANIRIDELANFGRNLLEQRKYEAAQARAAAPSDRPALKSIVKRVPSKMEKRVSFSELPPEVEEFYKNMDDEHSSTDEDDDCEVFEPEVFVSSDKSDETPPVEITPQGSPDERGEFEDVPLGARSPTPEEEVGAEPEHSTSPSISPSASFIYTPSPDEPVISFDDAYGPVSPNSPELEPEDVPLAASASPPMPSNWVGSAPINIGMDALKQQFPDKLSPEQPGPLNPEKMSFSQRLAWEERR